MITPDDPRLGPGFSNRIRVADDCWIWLGAKLPQGYGAWRRPGHTTRRAHLLVWRILVGPVPDGLELDHLCRVTACVNPAHMEAVTHRENMRRSVMASHARHSELCRPGRHLLTPSTTYEAPNGDRYCRECKRETNRRAYWKRRTECPLS